jgi:DNA-binding GntR family transcriptional regulator
MMRVDRADEPAGSAAIAERILRTETLRSQAIRALRAAIITGELAPGEVHSARELARTFGVSATPIREALLELARERLVEPAQNKGFRIVEVSDRDLREIVQLRVLVEIPAVGEVAGMLDNDMVAELAALSAEIETCAEQGDLGGFLDADRRFHIRLVEPLGNSRLLELLGTWRDQTRLYGLTRLVQEHSLLATAREHKEILNAVAKGQRREAEELMRRHLRHARGIWAGLPEPLAESRDDHV